LKIWPGDSEIDRVLWMRLSFSGVNIATSTITSRNRLWFSSALRCIRSCDAVIVLHTCGPEDLNRYCSHKVWSNWKSGNASYSSMFCFFLFFFIVHSLQLTIDCDGVSFSKFSIWFSIFSFYMIGSLDLKLIACFIYIYIYIYIMNVFFFSLKTIRKTYLSLWIFYFLFDLGFWGVFFFFFVLL